MEEEEVVEIDLATVNVPGPECYYEDAWHYRDDTDCSQAWRDFDNWCNNDDDADSDYCDRIN